jgi:hypothetical protein
LTTLRSRRRSLSRLPDEIQLAIVQAAVEKVVGVVYEDDLEAMVRRLDVLRVLLVVCKLWQVRQVVSDLRIASLRLPALTHLITYAITAPLLYARVVFDKFILDGPV